MLLENHQKKNLLTAAVGPLSAPALGFSRATTSLIISRGPKLIICKECLFLAIKNLKTCMKLSISKSREPVSCRVVGRILEMASQVFHTLVIQTLT